MSTDQIRVVAAIRANLQQEITVISLIGERVTGTCTFAGKNKFRVDVPLASMFFNYDEIEAVE